MSECVQYSLHPRLPQVEVSSSHCNCSDKALLIHVILSHSLGLLLWGPAVGGCFSSTERLQMIREQRYAWMQAWENTEKMGAVESVECWVRSNGLWTGSRLRFVIECDIWMLSRNPSEETACIQDMRTKSDYCERLLVKESGEVGGATVPRLLSHISDPC